MLSVSLEFDTPSRETDGGELSRTVPREMTLVNRSRSGPDRLHLQYGAPGPGPFHWKQLGTLYAIASEHPFQIRRPDSISVVCGGDETRHRRTYTLIAKPEGETLSIGVADYEDDREPVPVEWRPDSFLTSVEVSVPEYTDSVVSAAEGYEEIVRGREDVNDDRISVLLQHGRGIRDAIREVEGVGQFRLDPMDPEVQTYLYDGEFTEYSFSYFLIWTDVIRDEVQRLRASDEDVSKKYQALLSHESRPIQRETARVLEDTPDERALEWLLGRRWTDRPDIVTVALRAAARFHTDSVHEALRETVDFSSHPEIRRTAVELLAEYPRETTVSVLESVVEGDEDQSVRETARRTLDRVRE